ncbi:MAG: hypothetical protein ACR2HX_05760, partial [Pyrinomonadaceae bacterium]
MAIRNAKGPHEAVSDKKAHGNSMLSWAFVFLLSPRSYARSTIGSSPGSPAARRRCGGSCLNFRVWGGKGCSAPLKWHKKLRKYLWCKRTFKL